MALYASIDRRRLLDWLAGESLGSDLRQIDLSGSGSNLFAVGNALSPKSEMLLLWADEERANDRTVRPVIVTKDENVDDLLAWSSTFIATYSPFTAFFRVLSISDLERFEVFTRPQEWMDSRLRDDLAGVALAEAVIQTGFRSSGIKGINLQACEMTFSFAALKGINSGLHPAQLFDLADAWDRVRSASSQRPLALSAERALSFWLLATEALLSDGHRRSDSGWMFALSEFIRQVQASEERDPDLVQWSGEPAIKKILDRFTEALHLPRERQIKVLDSATKELLTLDQPLPLTEAVFGYMVSRLGDGSFDYLTLPAEYKDQLQASALWVAFFSMFREGFDGLTANYSLGRHVAKKARTSSNIFDTVSADISAREVQTISGKRRSGITNLVNPLIQVELLPCLTVPFPNPLKANGEEARRPPVTDLSRIHHLLREAMYLVERNAPDQQSTVRSGDPGELDLFKSRSGAGSSARRSPRPK